jgi:hypothetical protein
VTRDDEPFLSRWSRLKREKPAEEKTAADEAPAPALPPVESLTPESDFSGFMHPKVQDALRRVALKKLFSDPHFNVADPYEAYSGDWTGGEAIPEEMLATLNQAKQVLFREEEEKKREEEAKLAEKAETKEHDEPGRKDA